MKKKENRPRNSKKRRDPRKRQQRSAEFYKQFLPDPPPKRDYPPCPISGKPIRDVFTAISHPETGSPTNMESVIAELTKREQLEADERICYIGEGKFAVVQEKKVEGRHSLEIKRRIEYENTNVTCEWRRELSPGISRDYEPQPEPMSELYSPEEERQFPKFNRGGGSYMPRSG